MKILQTAAVLLAGILILPSDAFALSCGNRIVDIGDRKIEVFQKCGEPTFIEKWKTESTTLIEKKTRKSSKDRLTSQESTQETKTEYIEEWTYNFGPNRFIQFLTFTNDRLTAIEAGSYGFKGDFPTDFDKTRCGDLVRKADRKIEVIIKCGEPAFESTRTEEKSTSKIDSKKVGDRKIVINKSTEYQEDKFFLTITKWSFNFGPNYFLQFITFENGKVIKSEHGDYGYK